VLGPIISILIGGQQFDIELVVQLHSLELSAVIRYNTRLAETRNFSDIARALGRALECTLLVSNSQTITDIDPLSKHDAERIFRLNEQQPFIIEDCLHHLIQKSVSEHPESIALLSWDGSLTYSALDEHSSRLAHHLIKTFQIGPERVVPLCFEKSIWAVVAMLAVLKTGAAYCCVDPAHPQARRNYMIELVDASFVLCSPIHVALIQNRPALIVDAELIYGLATPSTSLQQNAKPESACVIAFTSGTTGNPKAIVHSHTSICSGLLANAPFQDINRRSIRLFQWAAYTFDVSITETFSPLIYGGLVCIPSEEERLNNVDEAMIRMGVDWAYFTPSFARFFRRFTIPSLKQLILGGEAVTVDDVRDWVDKVPVLNAYGPAESITWFLEPQKGLSSTISIGRPINMRAWITSPEDPGRLLPIGAIGELLIEGPSLFRQYIKNKEKTEQSLIEPPLWRLQANIGPAGKMYKTGDLVRYLPDGTMTYIGRKDTMVKLYGQRMELEEVETILRRNLPESIQSSADVIQPAGENEEPVLVAFLCVARGLGIPGINDLQELKSHLQNKLAEELPAFMVPRIYIPVESMPYNSSRKLDRARLRQSVTSLSRSQLIELIQSKESTSQSQDVSHNLSPMELALQKLWVDALLLVPSQIGPDDNFFSLGASSITALNVTAAAKSKGISISYPDLFRSPTLRSLAQTVSYSLDQKKTDVTIPRFSLIEKAVRRAVISDAATQCQVSEEDIEDIYPLAPQQQGLWALSLIREGDYMAQFILTLNTEADVDRFRAAWEQTVESLPTLRTRFIESTSGSYQVVLNGSVNWARSSDLKAYLQEDISIELAFGCPIVRHALVSNEAPDIARHQIVWTIHHALFDGESVPLFLNTVARAYEGMPLDPHAGPFNRFIEYTEAIDDSAASTYWRTQFDSTTPVAYPALPEQTYRPHPSSVYRKQVDFKRLERSQFTTATLLRAAVGLALVQAARSWDVTLGVTLAGRTAPVLNIEKVIGPTFVTLPTSIYKGVDDNVKDYLEHTQSSIIEMMPFEHTGMQNIARYSPQCEAACQFQTILLVQTPDDRSYTKLFSFDDTTGGFGRFNSHALMVLLFTNAAGVEAVFSYDNQIIDQEHVSGLADIFENFVHIMSLEEPSRSLASFISVEPTRSIYIKRVPRTSVQQNPDNKLMSTSNGNVVAQLSKMEASLAEAWAEVLKLPPQLPITANDEFVKTFGGNSLLSLRLAQWCRDHGIRLTVKDIFQHPKLSDMARVASLMHSANQDLPIKIAPFSLMRNQGELTRYQDSTEVMPIRIEAATSFGVPVESILDIYPATALQEGLLALSVTQPGSYVSQPVYELVDGVDIDRFRGAWNQIYKEEEILRTRLFQSTGVSGTTQVVVDSEIEWQFPTSLSDYLREVEESIGFGTPLSRFAIYQDNGRLYFVLTLHHALYDGWSFPLLLDRAYEIYFANGSSPKPHIAFNRFIQQIQLTAPSDTMKYWKSQFEDASFAHFPPPLPATQKPGRQINLVYSTTLPRSQDSGILTSTILRAAWALLLNTYTREQDVIFGATLSGRNVPLPGIEAVIGPTLTTLPIRVRIDKGVKTADFLRSVQDQSTGMIDYE
jgi:amino acid adenylation domain-containing protein